MNVKKEQSETVSNILAKKFAQNVLKGFYYLNINNQNQGKQNKFINRFVLTFQAK